MYTSRWTAPTVRDSAPPYGGGDSAEDGFPGDEVLDDLASAEDAERVERVLARFAAFRSWLLRVHDQPPELTDHALEAAASHLAAAPPDWPEAALLRRLLEVPVDGAEAAAVLAAAALESAGTGDGSGARALMHAAREALRRGGQTGLDEDPATSG